MAKAFARGRPIAPLVLSAQERAIWSGKSVATVLPDPVRAMSRHSAMCRRLSQQVGRRRAWPPRAYGWQVRRRFLKDRCDGSARRGSSWPPRTIDDDQVAAVIERTLRTTPATRRTGRSVRWRPRPAFRIRRSAYVGSVRPAAAPQPDFQVVDRSAFRRKVRDIVGLYLSPPNRALVLSIDEKSQIQALDREQPVFADDAWRTGAPGRTITCGTARPRCSQRSISYRFRHRKLLQATPGGRVLNFLKQIDARVAEGLEVHSYGQLRHPQDAQIKAWLARVPIIMSTTRRLRHHGSTR